MVDKMKPEHVATILAVVWSLILFGSLFLLTGCATPREDHSQLDRAIAEWICSPSGAGSGSICTKRELPSAILTYDNEPEARP